MNERVTFAEAEYRYKQGRIPLEEWERYCYRWRDGVYRFSTLGREEARRHAERTGLPLPSSDREEN